ncbi:VOC family protein [Actinoplanes sp. RD1]|uniref:VOC family protein n=1 Tax=Actinoplanes sp. RD1 TaxID=3064538 RepID=UPI0027420D9E|nr:VOC family protein [Actinoplanes sp. RD1]
MVYATIATVTMKTHVPSEVARFWRDLLGYQVAPNHSSSVLLVCDGQPALLIQPSAEQVEPSAIHLDLRPEDQAACVARAVQLGARHANVGQTGDEGWVVMADPGGNLFCVLQSQADHLRLLTENAGSPTPVE